ncbi:MAG: glucose-6-phosphate dehydrogenase [Acidimicrobiia bacterium]|nr:glucose-6-phosphate dehydrogenase [Acidimicrobiia bacterium]
MNSSADALCWFGASGDLAYKMTFPALYAMSKRGRLTVPVVGVAYSDWTLEDLRERGRASLAEHATVDDPEALDHLMASLRYVDGDYADAATFEALRSTLDGLRSSRPAHYLAIPPSLFGEVVESLGSSGCAEGARVIVEKPFGRDLASAQELNRIVHRVFDEDDVYRIDHFLGKQEVLNLMYLRFANSFFEPIWNRDHIASVQITMAEDFGVQGRGRFYEEVGALRDVVQNHLLQVVALLAMEPPVGQGVAATRDEKARVFKAMSPLHSKGIVRGQFDGYQNEEGVADDSDVETYVAVRLHIDSWRWAGVPWYIRAGKELPVHATEVRVELKAPPQRVFRETSLDHGDDDHNHLRFRLQPQPEIALGLRSMVPGDGIEGRASELTLCEDVTDERTPYERLLTEALAGDPLLFTREDSVEAAWKVVEHVLEDHPAAIPYVPGSWGPPEAEDLLPGKHRWADPVMPGDERR